MHMYEVQQDCSVYHKEETGVDVKVSIVIKRSAIVMSFTNSY